jgi:hypothetical protein
MVSRSWFNLLTSQHEKPLGNQQSTGAGTRVAELNLLVTLLDFAISRIRCI